MALTPEGGQRKWENNWEQWKLDCAKKHDNKFTYPSMERVKDENGRWKVEIICPEHGSFFQDPAKHKFGQGCSVCSGNTNTETDIEFAEKHFPEIDWTGEIRDRNNKKRLVGICKHHGEFNKINSQLRGIVKSEKGHACPRCAKTLGGLNRRVTKEEWIARIKEHFPEYEVDVSSIETAVDLVKVTCPEHGTWEPRLQDLAAGHGCLECWKNSKTSRGEREVGDFVESLGLTALRNFHIPVPSVLSDDFVKDLGEFDVVAVKRNGDYVFIDYHGMYFHGDKVQLNKDAHADKLDKLKDTDFQYVQIFEDEWAFQKEKVKTRLAHILGESSEVWYARKLKVEQITWKEAETFYRDTHLQGAGTKTGENYALKEGEEILACMSFAKPRFDKEIDKELLRFASRGSVVGGFSRLLKKFKENNPDCRKLLSYADRRWSEGNVYKSAGFEFVGNTKPNYAWYKNLNKVSRYDAQRHKLETLFGKEFPETMSEAQIMRSEGYWRVFDAGNSKWVLTIS